MANWINSKGNVEMLERLDLVKEQLASELASPIINELANLEDRVAAKLTELSSSLSEQVNQEASKNKQSIQAVYNDVDLVDARATRRQKLVYKRLKDKIAILQDSLDEANNKAIYQIANLEDIAAKLEALIATEKESRDKELVSMQVALKLAHEHAVGQHQKLTKDLEQVASELNKAKKYGKIAIGSLAALIILILVIGGLNG